MLARTTKPRLDLTKAHLSQFGWKIIHDWSFSLAVIIGYNLLVSLLPLLLSLFAIATLVFSPAVLESIRTRLVQAFPNENLGQGVDTLLKSLSNQAGLVFFISFCISVFSGSRLLIAIDDSLTIIYRVRERPAVAQNIHAIKMLLIFIILIPVIIITSALPAIFISGEEYYQLGTTASSVLFVFILFELLYYYVPKRQMYLDNTYVKSFFYINKLKFFLKNISRWCGALFATIGLQTLFQLFPLYVHLFMSNYMGQLALIIITVLFFYITGVLFVIGAQINAYFYDHIAPLPAGLGDCLSQFFDHESRQLIDINSQPNNSMSTLKEGFNPEH